MKKNNMRFAFFGTGDFAVKILEILLQNNYIPEIIITTPDKLKGRKMELTPSPVKTWAQKNNIKTTTDYSLLSTCLAGRQADYSLFIVADYGKIIPKEILNIPKHGSLNIHPSLLPKFRGPSPIQSFILSGEKETGTTIILMDEEVDHGAILKNAKIKNQNVKLLYYKELEKKLAELGGNLLVEILPKWLDGKIKPQEQNHNEATFTKKIAKQDGLIKPDELPESIYKKILAYTPWPGTHIFADNKRIIITNAELKNNKLIIKKIKPEGKKEIPFDDFYREIIGKYLKKA